MRSPCGEIPGSAAPPLAAPRPQHRNLCKKHEIHFKCKGTEEITDSLTVHRSTASVDVNKGGGGGGNQNKRGHLAEESEACWVIKGRVDEGALCG